MISPIVVYLGPSQIDGSPIVVLASTQSTNAKTGPLIQTWILCADRNPVESSRLGLDAAVCGRCPRRHHLGGDCYVPIWQAPRAVWAAWERSGSPSENWADPVEITRLSQDAITCGLRLGSYGDPAAVPHAVWADLISALQPRCVTGYTHQWRAMQGARHTWFRENTMASVDSLQEAYQARTLGWRYFLAISEEIAKNPPKDSIQCPADPVTCSDCALCAGSKRRAKSIFLVEHGARAKRSLAILR